MVNNRREFRFYVSLLRSGKGTHRSFFHHSLNESESLGRAYCLSAQARALAQSLTLYVFHEGSCFVLSALFHICATGI